MWSGVGRRGWLPTQALCQPLCSALSLSRWTASRPWSAGSLWSTWRTSRSSMSAGDGRCVSVQGWGAGGPGGFLAPSRVPVHILTWQFLFCLPQLSFSIVSLCNHLTRSLMKKARLRPDEDMVGKCSLVLLGRILGWLRLGGGRQQLGPNCPPAPPVLHTVRSAEAARSGEPLGWCRARGPLTGSRGFWRILNPFLVHLQKDCCRHFTALVSP